jgi:hypothetical protein
MRRILGAVLSAAAVLMTGCTATIDLRYRPETAVAALPGTERIKLFVAPVEDRSGGVQLTGVNSVKFQYAHPLADGVREAFETEEARLGFSVVSAREQADLVVRPTIVTARLDGRMGGGISYIVATKLAISLAVENGAGERVGSGALQGVTEAERSGGAHPDEFGGYLDAALADAMNHLGPIMARPLAASPAPAAAPRIADAATSAAEPAANSDVDRPSYSRPEDADRFGVVVGVEAYAGLPAARFARRDALAVRDHLLALGFPARNVLLLSDQEATKGSLLKALNSWLPNRVTGNSTVFFYYSGHGAPDPKSNRAYLVPIDGDPEDLEDTAYPLKELYAKLDALKAKRVIVALDSCFSGAGGRSVMAKDARPLVTKLDLGAVASDKIVTLSASKGDQISGALEDQAHGAFTYYLLKGLNGAAQDGDGHVTLKTLYDYLAPKVADAARLHNRDQQPQLVPAAGAEIDARLR